MRLGSKQGRPPPATRPAGRAPRAGSGAMFDAIADRYDLLNRLMALGLDQRWRRQTARALRLGAGARVLDLATGTGDLALAVLDARPDCSVVGIDPSTRMVAVGHRKVRATRFADRIAMTIGDAQRLPFAADSFDGACMAFGIRNVPDRAQALREIARVVRTGGRVAILELGQPRRGPISALARLYIRALVPSLGRLLSGAREYGYLRRSIEAFPAPSAFAATLRANGFRSVQVRSMGFGSCHLYLGTA